MKIQIRDVLSLSGRDYVVEGLVLVQVAGQTTEVARAVDGADVLWIESPQDHGSALVFHQIKDLELSPPPPESISYHGLPYVLRLAGRAALEIKGAVPERTAGRAHLWRYRTAGDQILQIEEEAGHLFMLAGQSVHRGMIDHLPGR